MNGSVDLVVAGSWAFDFTQPLPFWFFLVPLTDLSVGLVDLGLYQSLLAALSTIPYLIYLVKVFSFTDRIFFLSPLLSLHNLLFKQGLQNLSGLYSIY